MVFEPISPRRWKSARVPAALLVVTLLLLAGTARAEDEKCLVGMWEGTYQDQKDDEVVITSVRVVVVETLDRYPGDATAGADSKGIPPQSAQYIRFGPPAACRLDLLVAGRHDDKNPDKGVHYHLTMINPTGGSCTTLNKLQLKLACTTDRGVLHAWFREDKATADRRFDLTRASK